MTSKDLFHANVVHQPIYQDYDRPSRSLWQSLRRRHLLHPSGIPLFNPDRTYRSHRPLSPAEARSLPSDWVVVLGKWPKSRTQAMANFEEVEAEVVRRLGHERVVVFNGLLPILQACLYIAAHGAALANMVFMPEESSVLEIRPEGCHVIVYHALARACSLRYHLIFSKGDWFSLIVDNMTNVAEVLDSLHARIQKEDNGGVSLY
ncbi:unnamed protein product [Closterium sp. NIES-65]|nr:unnamed protein product [Closterium sp. NIES-65]